MLLSWSVNLDKLKPTGIPAIDKLMDKAKAQAKAEAKVIRYHQRAIEGLASIRKAIKKPKA
jgi:hypothetical protein